jgi:hypothetical protein
MVFLPVTSSGSKKWSALLRLLKVRKGAKNVATGAGSNQITSAFLIL